VGYGYGGVEIFRKPMAIRRDSFLDATNYNEADMTKQERLAEAA